MRYVMREKIFALGGDFTVKDDQGHDRFVVDGKVFHIGHKLIIRDMDGNEAATVHQELLALRQSYQITRAGHELAEVRKKLFTVLHDRFIVDIPGPDDLEITGSIFQHDYSFTRAGRVIAVVSTPWVALTDTYVVDIEDGQDDVVILASTMVVDLINEDRRDR